MKIFLFLRIIYPIGNNESLQMAIWSPTGSSLAYVFNNNLYFVSSPDSISQQITLDGVPGIIYNGVPDWVYEGKLLEFFCFLYTVKFIF